MPSFRPLFDFRETLRYFFTLSSWRPLPSCGRGIGRNRPKNAFARQRSQGVLRGDLGPKTWARYGHNNDSRMCLFVSNGAIHCPAFLEVTGFGLTVTVQFNQSFGRQRKKRHLTNSLKGRQIFEPLMGFDRQCGGLISCCSDHWILSG